VVWRTSLTPTKKVAGMAMMGPSGIVLGKKKTMRKQKKGRKGSKNKGKSRHIKLTLLMMKFVLF